MSSTNPNALKQYIDTKRTSSANWNITGLGSGWTGKFKIPDDEYDSVFLPLVHNHVFVHGQACSLLERQGAQSPIVIDLDFHYPSGGPLQRRFTEEHIRAFVAAYAEALGRFWCMPEGAETLQFFVSLKPAPERDPAHNRHKDGIHIICPTLTLPRSVLCAIRGYLLQTGAIEQVFGNTEMTNSADDCLDLTVTRTTNPNNWFLYGACKPDKAWYKLEYVYSILILDASAEEDELVISPEDLSEESVDDWTPLDLIRLLSVRVNHTTPTNIIQRHAPDTVLGADWALLMKQFGDGKKPSKTAIQGQGQGPISNTNTNTNTITYCEDDEDSAGAGAGASAVTGGSYQSNSNSMSVRNKFSSEDIALAYKLVRECLDPERRCGDYHDWINTGICLKNISNTDESFEAWANLTRRTSDDHKKAHMTDAELREKWKLIPAEDAIKKGRRPLLMGTLHMWAKEDAPIDYRAIIALASRDLAIVNDSGTHVSVANLVVRMYRHEFRCTPPKKGASGAMMDWFIYESHTWRALQTNLPIRERLSNEVRFQYIEADRELGRRIGEAMKSGNPDAQKQLEEKRKKLLKIESALETSTFKSSVMVEVAEKFYEENFANSLNNVPDILGFSNGVLELRHVGDDGNPRVLFRPGRPDDCISFQMGRGMNGMDAIPYIPYDPANPTLEHKEIMDFFSKIYPDPVLREYVLTLYGACLEGINREQKFYIMTGSGGNGKSKIIDLLSMTFGEYQETLPVTTLTRKRADGGSANPELVVIKCKRLITMVEPEDGEKINTSLMKQLSGGDIVKMRGLFKDQDQMVVMGRIFMACNRLPPVNSSDGGTWRRTRVIDHVSTFVELDKPTNPSKNIYHRDASLETKFPKWRAYFAGMLVWYYENVYLRNGLIEPASVQVATNKYKEANDVFAEFSSECLKREVGAEVKFTNVWKRFNEWAKFNPGKKSLAKDIFKEQLNELFGTPLDGTTYAGVRIAYEDEDISGNVV